MQITINQDELEVAVRDYVAKQGITRTVGDINFTAVRSPSNQILTEIVLSDKAATTSTPAGPNVRSVTPVAEAQAPAPEKAKAEKPKAAFPAPAEKPEAVAEEAPVAEADVAEEEAPAAPAGKSLFG